MESTLWYLSRSGAEIGSTSRNHILLFQQKRHPHAWNGMNTPLQAAPILIAVMKMFVIAVSIFRPSLIVITRKSCPNKDKKPRKQTRH